MASQQSGILVTGGTGFLGSALVDYLVGQGERVRVLDLRPGAESYQNGLVDSVVGDITSSSVINNALDGVGQVYHLAAAHQGDWAIHKAVTVDAFAQLLEAYAEQGGGRIVAMSSVMVYDAAAMSDGAVINEDFPKTQDLEHVGNYPRAKVQAERVAQDYLSHSLVKLTLLRAGVIYGPGMPNPLNGVALPVKRRLLVVLGRGNKQVPLIYIDDIVKALVRTMHTDAMAGQAYNLVDPHAPTQNEHLELYRQLTGDRRPILRVPSSLALALFGIADRVMQATGRGNDSLGLRAKRAVKKFKFDSDRLRREAGVEPAVGFQDGLRMTLAGGRRD